MKSFIHSNFLLHNKTAQLLYHEFAEGLPIIDYHSHLNPNDIAGNHRFKNLTQAWLEGDHYKWRAMRANGIDEYFITGKAKDEEKFLAWASTVPYTLRNPLYHWTHLELQAYFGISELLNAETANAIYQNASEKLQSEEYSTVGLLKKMSVEVACTTNDPLETLEAHQKIRTQEIGVKVVPSWRPDQLMAVENPQVLRDYIHRLGESADIQIDNYKKLLEAVDQRHAYFHLNGCRLSDQGLNTFYATDYFPEEIEKIFRKLWDGHILSAKESEKYKAALLHDLAVMNHKRGWVQQYHVGALRNNNSRMYEKIGPDTGFDSIGDFPMAVSMSKFFSRLDKENVLTKTILYNLNPAFNEVMATMAGNFQDGSVPGKIQWGAAWWFLDQKDGIVKQLNTLSNMGLLSRFVGMLTDSRSFLSFPRHEYFRRILCNLVGEDVEHGELPRDMDLLGSMVQNICYYNAKQYFNF